MNEPKLKEVDFSKYCPTCAHEKVSDTEQPCCECLDNPGNVNSSRPKMWEDKNRIVAQSRPSQTTGKNGVTFTPSMSKDGILSWTNDGNLKNPEPVKLKGKDGDDGYSPVVTVEDIDGGHRVIITDVEGKKQFNVMDGKDRDTGSVGGGAIPDWNQNDETAPDYIKNRTHYEIPEETIVSWDGNMEGRAIIDIGDIDPNHAGNYLVKVSDSLPYDGDIDYQKDMVGWCYIYGYQGAHANNDVHDSTFFIHENSFYFNYFPGAIFVNGFDICFVYAAEILCNALGVPNGYITGGTYFLYCSNDEYAVTSLIKPGVIKKIDKKFIPSRGFELKGYIDVDALIESGSCVVGAYDEDHELEHFRNSIREGATCIWVETKLGMFLNFIMSSSLNAVPLNGSATCHYEENNRLYLFVMDYKFDKVSATNLISIRAYLLGTTIGR